MYTENFSYENTYPKEPPSYLYEADDIKLVINEAVRMEKNKKFIEEVEGIE